MDDRTVHLSLAESWTAEGGRKTFTARRVVFGPDTCALELTSGTRKAYPRRVIDSLDIADGVEIVRSGNPR